MDMLQGFAPIALDLYHTADPYLRPVRSAISDLQTRTYPMISPYLDRAAVAAQDSPNLITVGVLLLSLLIAWQVFNFAWRIVMWWIRLVFWTLVTVALVSFAGFVWQRGPEGALDDVVRWAGYLGELGWEYVQVWWRYYGEYKNQEYQARTRTTGYGGNKGSWT